MLKEMFDIVFMLDMLHMFADRPISGHFVAKHMVGSWSRSTTYRKLKRAEKLGIVAYADTGNCYEWVVTPDGRTFKEAWNELPF